MQEEGAVSRNDLGGQWHDGWQHRGEAIRFSEDCERNYDSRAALHCPSPGGAIRSRLCRTSCRSRPASPGGPGPTPAEHDSLAGAVSAVVRGFGR